VYLQLIVFQILFVMGLFFVATTMTYFLQYYVGRPLFLGHTQVASGLCVILWVVIWNYITPHIGKVWVLRIGTFMLAAGGLSSWIAYTPENPWRAFIFPLVWGPGWAAYQVMMPAIVADITDLDELETGDRREGSYASVAGFVMKLVATSVAIPIGLVLDYLVGFQAGQGADQPEAVWFRMKLYTAVVTCVFSLLALLTIVRFPLTRQRMLEVRAELDARRDAESREDARPEVVE
jgi:GPH family glycoside/pentoside/hexuronide:cation symporter